MSRLALRAFTASLGLVVLGWLAPALAQSDEFVHATRLMHNGESQQALGVVDEALQRHPSDVQLRFLRGVLLTEQQRVQEAIDAYTALSRDHPELPEPYNNLAVLQARQGAYDRARASLAMAIKANPRYATAYENLGDIHVQLAAEAYAHVLRIDPDNRTAAPKLSLIRSLRLTPGLADAGAPVHPAASP